MEGAWGEHLKCPAEIPIFILCFLPEASEVSKAQTMVGAKLPEFLREVGECSAQGWQGPRDSWLLGILVNQLPV